jgi:hypothetical protein
MLQHIGLLFPGYAQLPACFTVSAVGTNDKMGCYDFFLTGPDIGERQYDAMIRFRKGGTTALYQTAKGVLKNAFTQEVLEIMLREVAFPGRADAVIRTVCEMIDCSQKRAAPGITALGFTREGGHGCAVNIASPLV